MDPFLSATAPVYFGRLLIRNPNRCMHRQNISDYTCGKSMYVQVFSIVDSGDKVRIHNSEYLWGVFG